MGTDEETTLQDEQDNRSNRRLRFGVGAFACVILFCIVASIELSTIDLNFASFIYGSEEVWLGHRASFRVAAIDAQTKRPLSNLELKATLKAGDAALESIKAQGHQWVEFNIKIPKKLPAAPLILEIVVESEEGMDTSRIQLRPLATPGPIKSEFQPLSRLYEDDNAQAPREVNGYQLKLYPLGGHLVSGLTNSIVGQLFLNGTPTQGAIQSDELSLLKTASPEGLVEFDWRPMISPRPLQFKVGNQPIHSQTVRIKPRPSQLLLQRSGTWFNQPGSSVASVIRTLPFRGRFHIDVWAGNCLLLAASEFPEGDAFEFSLKLPPDFEGMLRIDAYKNFMAPQGTVTSSHLWVTPKPRPMAEKELLSTLEKLPQSEDWKWAIKGEPELRRAMIPLLLTRLFPLHKGAPLLLSTLEARRATVTEGREDLRKHIHHLFFITIISGALLLGAWIFIQRRRVRRDVREVIQEGILQGEDLDVDAIADLSKQGNFVEALITLGAIALSLYSIYILLSQLLNWGW